MESRTRAMVEDSMARVSTPLYVTKNAGTELKTYSVTEEILYGETEYTSYRSEWEREFPAASQLSEILHLTAAWVAKVEKLIQNLEGVFHPKASEKSTKQAKALKKVSPNGL